MGTNKVVQTQASFQLLLYLLQHIPCLFKAVPTKLSNGHFSATSFHFTFLPPLKVSYSIHSNNPGKLKGTSFIYALKHLLLLVGKFAHLLLHILFDQQCSMGSQMKSQHIFSFQNKRKAGNNLWSGTRAADGLTS